MLKYAKVINEESGLCEVGIGTNTSFYESIGMQTMDVEQSDVDNKWYLTSKCPHKTEEEKTQDEAERVANLKMTPRDFLLAVVEMGVDYSAIKALMASNPQVEIELQFCNFVYRGNPLLNQFCEQFNVTSEQLDELFKSKGM